MSAPNRTAADPSAVRQRLETARQDLARAEGELETFRRESDSARERLRELLGCEAGDEKAALKELQASIEDDEREIAALLDAAEEADAERPNPEEALVTPNE